MHFCNGALLAVWLAIVGDALAVDRRWNNGTGSFVFGTAGNWQGGIAPGALDVAQFGISAPLFPAGAYTVIFNNSITNQALHIEDDLVTFNLNSRVYGVTAATGMVIANQSNSFSARLTVTNGTITSTTGGNFDVGAVANKTGTLNVNSGGQITGSPNLNIGKVGTGTLNVDLGGVISTTGSTTIGAGSNVTGTATILGNASPASASLLTGALNVGSPGDGTINVQLGGLLQNSGTARLGTGSPFTGIGTGVVNVMNAGSVWNSLGLLEVGAGGTGEVNVTLGGTVNGAGTTIGASTSRGGEVNIDGLNSKWDNSGTLTIGGVGAGTLSITNQGVLETTDTILGSAGLSTSTGTVNVSGTGSRWTGTGDLKVGFAGTGTLNITAGGEVEATIASIGY